MFHIVDDNLIGGQNTAKIINLFCDMPLVFSSAIEYLEYVNSPDYQKPDAIFTDVLMFKMNGYELIEEVLAIHPDQRFVIISGRPDLNHPYKNRACIYLTKPFYSRDIQKIIQTLKKCELDGPSPETDCANRCDCSEFALDNWACPHLEAS
ncbi:MAG: response regulator [Mariprofundaceae bacterium]